MKSKSFYKNINGINIVKCCASCKKCMISKNARVCIIGQGIVSPSYLCGSWALKEAYYYIGKGDGNIKKRDYLRFVIDNISSDKKKPLALLREEFTSKQGTIYEIEDEPEKI